MTTANSILSVTAQDFDTLLVLFGNAGVGQLTVDLTPLASPGTTYTLARVGSPSVPALVVSAAAYGQTGSQVLGVTLKTDQELSPGKVYTLITSGITGITVDSVHNVAAFVAHDFDFPANRKYKISDWIPRINVVEDTSGELADFMACLQEPLNFMVHDVDHWVDILDADVAPENFVDLMLEDLANPFVFRAPLTLVQKRRLAVSLVEIYKLKGTTLGCQIAIQFFLGMQSEFVPLEGLGNKLNRAGGPYTSALSSTGHALTSPHTPLKLGSRRPWRFLIKLGTTVRSQTDVGQTSPAPAAGGPLTDAQREQIDRILAIMKPAYMIRVLTGTDRETGPAPTVRVAIEKIGSNISIKMKTIDGVDGYTVFGGESPGVSQYSAGDVTSTGSVGFGVFVSSLITPLSTPRYWNGAGTNSAFGTVGLLANEVTNALAKPSVTATGMLRKIRLTWPPVPNATAYRIYRSTSAATYPVLADNADSPIEISSDSTTYDDAQESGTSKHYLVTPMLNDSEGFYSTEVSASAL